jgi:hypothetical protein
MVQQWKLFAALPISLVTISFVIHTIRILSNDSDVDDPEVSSRCKHNLAHGGIVQALQRWLRP